MGELEEARYLLDDARREVDHLLKICREAKPVTPLSVEIESLSSLFTLQSKTEELLREQGYDAMADDLLSRCAGRRDYVGTFEAASDYIRVTLSKRIDLGYEAEKIMAVEPEGRIALARLIADDVGRLDKVKECIVDDFNRERSSFALFAQVDFPENYIELRKYSLRGLAQRIRKTVSSHPACCSEDIIMPKRVYDTLRNEKIFRRYDNKFIQFDILVH